MNNTMHTAKRLSRCIAVLLLMAAAPLCAGAQTVEYFWNTDPGIGRGQKLAAAAQSDGYATVQIDAAALSRGANLLGMRAAVKGRWSQTLWNIVLVEPQATDGTAATAEYFWNDDPGIGQATTLSLAPSGTGHVISEISVDALPAGVSTLGVRVNKGGIWSQTHTYLVVIPASTGEADWQVEYFCDEDPGPGLATPIDAAVTGNGGIVDVELLAADLAPGVHTLGFRARSAGIWSQTVTATVYVPREGSTLIAQAEYFWGADPGLGAGTPIDLPGQTDGQTVTVDALTLDFPTEVADEYVLSFRARSEEGWGTTVTKIIPHLYVEEIALSTEAMTLVPDSSARIDATIAPEDAFVPALQWTSSDEQVATVDADGVVTAIADGIADITARATDGSEAAAVCRLTVLTPPTGDSNMNGTVNIADAVNTANYAVGNDVETFYFKAADVNRDSRITISDAAATVSIIMQQTAEATVAAKVRALAKASEPGERRIVIDRYAAGCRSNVALSIDAPEKYVALQADLTLPEGMTLHDVRLAAGATHHTLATRFVGDRTVRVVLFDPDGHTLAAGTSPLLELTVSTSATERLPITADNVIAADAQAH